MNCWQFLQIQPTEDEAEIKRAYSKLLKVYHPEKDNEGFMRLRAAYEEALELLRRQPEEDNSQIGQWMKRVDEVYNDYARRLDITEWESLLEDDLCMAIDSSAECNEKLLIYISDHIFIPHEVLKVLENFFHWENKREQLSENFPPNFIDYLIANSKYEDNFRYYLVPQDMPINYDAFFESYYHLDRIMYEEDKEKIKSVMEQLLSYDISHPDVQMLVIRTYIHLEENEKALKLCGQLSEIEPDREKYRNFKARCYLETGLFEEAMAIYKEIAEENKEDVSALLGVSTCCKELGRYDEAVEYVKRAQDILPYDAHVKNYAIIMCEEALEHKRSYYEGKLDDPNMQYEYCNVLADACQFDEAKELLKRMDKDNYSEKDYCKLCARVYLDIQNQQCEEAIPYLERMIEFEPDCISYYEDLGYCYGEAKRYEDAKKIYEKGKRLDVTSPRIYYRLAQIYIKEEQYEKAVKACDEGLSYHSDIPNLYHFKAEAYYYMREYAKALDNCDLAMSILPYIDTYEIKAKIFNDCGEYDAVCDLLENMIGTEFFSDMLCAQLARAKRRLGNTDEACKLLEDKMAAGTDEAEIYYQRAIIYFLQEGDTATEDYQMAVKMADEALDRDKTFCFEHLLLKCQALMGLGKNEDALKAYREYEKRGIMNERMALAIGDLLLDMEDADKALNYYKKALEINAESFGAHGRMCDAYMQLNQYDKALKEVKLQLVREPSDYYLIDEGIIYSELSDRIKAIECFKKALEENEENCYAWCNLAYCLREGGELAHSLEAFLKAISTGHPNPKNYYEAARLYSRLGKHEEALELLNKLTEMGEDQYVSITLKINILCILGRLSDAEEVCRQLYEQYPKNRIEALQYWADIYKHTGDYKSVIKIWKQYGSADDKNSFGFYRYMAGLYKDYICDDRKALKYYKKAYQLQPKDGYVCSKLGVLYERAGKLGKAMLFYKQAFELDKEILDDEPESACSNDCVGMDYCWLRHFDKGMKYFYKAIYYGSKCEHCSKGECYEVFFDIGDAMERKAELLRKGELKEDYEKLSEWADKKIRSLERIEEIRKSKESAEYIPSKQIVIRLREFVDDCLKSISYEECIRLSYKYYLLALQEKSLKKKYQDAFERLKRKLNEI